MLFPTNLEKSDDRCLLITWSDDVRQKIPFRKLRESCRCAHCMDERMKGAKPAAPAGSLPVLSAAEAMPLDILQMNPVGNYAYHIRFSDGHNSGIFPFELLRSINE